ncbi:MAG: anti-sigma factor family protein [Longimicrobiales bacterium]
MMHVDNGTLQALLDNEVGASDRMAVQGHLASCAECAAELEEMRQIAADARRAFAQLDAYAPMLEGRVSVDPAVRRIEKARRFVRLVPASLARAAALVLLVAGAASAAIPGSPVRRWAGELMDRAARLLVGDDSAAPAPPGVVDAPRIDDLSTGTVRDTTAGLAVALNEGAVRIEIFSAEPGARIQVRVLNEEEAWVKTFGSIRPRTRSGNGWMNVYGVDELGAVVDLPRSARAASVTVNGDLFYEYRDGVGRAVGPVAESTSDGAVFLAR